MHCDWYKWVFSLAEYFAMKAILGQVAYFLKREQNSNFYKIIDKYDEVVVVAQNRNSLPLSEYFNFICAKPCNWIAIFDKYSNFVSILSKLNLIWIECIESLIKTCSIVSRNHITFKYQADKKSGWFKMANWFKMEKCT